jgi:hypothetical protein
MARDDRYDDRGGLGRMGTSFDEEMLKSPLTVGRPRNEPGPEVHNSPVLRPEDPLRLIPENARRAGSRR